MDPGSDRGNSENILNEEKEAFDNRENLDGSLDKINEICIENSGRFEIKFISKKVAGKIDLRYLQVAQKKCAEG